ncbi:outer membrane protein assembly factor BamB family protein [Spirosoma gilvum]
MKTVANVFIGFLLFCAVLGGVINLFRGKSAEQKSYFAANAPVKAITLSLPFPTDLLYQSSPDSTVVIGTRKQESGFLAISAFDRSTAKRLWQLPLEGTVVGQTRRQLLVYETKTATVHFVDPRTGKITRKVSPEPAPLTSPSSLYTGMAFTDELYLTTKPLYQQVVIDGKVDTAWRIGITAKTWETNELNWFVPPVNQIVTIAYPPVVYGDKVLIINAEQKVGEGHSFQIVSLKTGQEQYRSTTAGTYYLLGQNHVVERTNTFVRRVDPFAQREIWRLDGNFSFGQLWAMGDQLSILSRRSDDTGNTLRIVDSVNGRLRKQIDLPFFKETAIKGAYVTRDNQLLLHFAEPNFSESGTHLYDYWVCYDPQTRQALWRTDFHSESISSLLPFIHL